MTAPAPSAVSESSSSVISPPVIRRLLTARDTSDRLAEHPALSFTPEAPAGVPSILVDPARQFQRIEGIGGAFTESAASVLRKLSPANQKRVMEAYFDAASGHGYTLCRTHMNSCDFSLGNYADAATPGDVSLSHFNIDREKGMLLPMIKEAHALSAESAESAEPPKLFVSPWSPPPWMKTNGEMNHGGKLKPEYRDTWAQHYVKFIEAFQREGVDVWAITVQNEPAAIQTWDSCTYTPEEERDFVRDHLGPALGKAGLGHVKIIVWDHNRDWMVKWAHTIYGDPEAAKYVWGTGIHWYGDDAFDHCSLHHDLWPDKAILFTEGCQEGGPHTGEWMLGERYGRSMINDFNRWVCGWVDWNLLLDETGGPNHVGNLCSAPIIADTVNDQVLIQSSYWYIGHFARFVRPGAHRILCAATREGIEATAFLNPGGTVAIVAMNRTDEPQTYSIDTPAGYALASVPAHSISTYTYQA